MATFDTKKPITTLDSLNSATHAAMQHLATHGEQSAAIYNGHQQRIQQVKRNPDTSAEYKARQIEGSRQQALGEAGDLKQRTADAMQTIAAAHTAARRPASDPAAEMLAYQKQRDAWTRAERQLQRGTPAGDIIAAASKAGDTDTLAALRAELPSYLSPAEAHAAMQQLTEAEAPHLTTVERGVRAQEAVLPDLQAAAKTNENGLDWSLNDASGRTPMRQFIGPNKTLVPTQQATQAGRGGLEYSH